MTISFLEPNPDASIQTEILNSHNFNTNLVKEPNILIVEDEEGVRDLLVQLLYMEGYKTTAVDNGFDAVTSFQRQQHDLVFTDFRMPGMSGAEVTKAIKSCNSDTPVVLVTGWDPESFAEELQSSGVDHVLKKPFDMNELLNLVSELMQRAA